MRATPADCRAGNSSVRGVEVLAQSFTRTALLRRPRPAGVSKKLMHTTLQGATALLALSHSPAEHTLYEALLAASSGVGSSLVESLSLRRLLELRQTALRKSLRSHAPFEIFPIHSTNSEGTR